jgi:thioredoxin 1
VDAVAAEHSQHARVVKLNVDDNPAVTDRYGIRGIPTLILFKGGEERERLIGVTNGEEISRVIDKHLKAASN